MDNKSEGEQVIDEKAHVMQALDRFTKEKKDLEEKVIEPAKQRIDDEIERLNEKKNIIDEMKQELNEKKEKLNEFKQKEIEEPIKDIGKQYIEKLKENVTPEKLLSRLGYNLQKQEPDSHEPTSAIELIKGKNDLKSDIDPHLLIKKEKIDIRKKVNSTVDDFSIGRKVTADPGEEQVEV